MMRDASANSTRPCAPVPQEYGHSTDTGEAGHLRGDWLVVLPDPGSNHLPSKA